MSGGYDTLNRLTSANATLNFVFTDMVGTRRVMTDYGGDIQETCHSLPYGNGEDCAASPTEHLFTGKERDAETGNDYFGARYYASSMGRFLTPDWSAKVEPVPYSKLDDPQTLNLYAYVGNNPLIRLDADGHDPMASGGSTAIDDGEAKAEAAKKNYQHQPTKDANIPVVISDVKANTPLGHSTIQVGSDKRVGLVPNSEKQVARAVARQTAELLRFGAPLRAPVPGHVESNSAQVRSSTTIYVSADQANHMRSFISEAEHSPQTWDAAFHNCANGFTEQALRAGGVNAPTDSTPGGLVQDLKQ